MNNSVVKFSHKIAVDSSSIDFQGHVSNVAIMKMINDVNIAHTVHAGWGPSQYRAIGGMFVVRRNEVDYKGQAFLGDELTVETWVQEMVGKRAIRTQRIVRDSDAREISVSTSYFTFVDISTGASKEIPEALKAAFLGGDYV